MLPKVLPAYHTANNIFTIANNIFTITSIVLMLRKMNHFFKAIPE